VTCRSRTHLLGGTYLSQGVGSGSNRELYEALMGPQPGDEQSSADRAATEAQAVGLHIVDLRQEATRVEFLDIAAVVHFLRKVVWTVPDFTVVRYRRQLADLHERISREGCFVAHSQRYLIEAQKPTWSESGIRCPWQGRSGATLPAAVIGRLNKKLADQAGSGRHTCPRRASAQSTATRLERVSQFHRASMMAAARRTPPW
jgi:hypothetical protein